jgi:hypothetical protein
LFSPERSTARIEKNPTIQNYRAARQFRRQSTALESCCYRILHKFGAHDSDGIRGSCERTALVAGTHAKFGQLFCSSASKNIQIQCLNHLTTAYINSDDYWSLEV